MEVESSAAGPDGATRFSGIVKHDKGGVFCCLAANALNTPQSHFGVKLGFAAKKCCKWEWTRGNLRGGFLICENNQGGEMVKKIHLGLASSGYCPCPHRAPTVPPPCHLRILTVPPPCPHAWR